MILIKTFSFEKMLRSVNIKQIQMKNSKMIAGLKTNLGNFCDLILLIG